MSDKVALVPFERERLLTIQREGVVSVAMKPVVEALGLAWRSQYNRLMRHPVLATSVFIMKTEVRGSARVRDQLFLPIAYLNGWLFGIDTSRVRPELRVTLEAYQRECFIALDAYWRRGWATNPRVRQINDVEQPHDGLGKTTGQRFAEERAKWDAANDTTLMNWFEGTGLLSKARMRAIEQMDARIDDKLHRYLIGLGLDVHYILYGKRLLTDSERAVRDVMRLADPTARAALIAHAETIEIETAELRDVYGETVGIVDRRGTLIEATPLLN